MGVAINGSFHLDVGRAQLARVSHHNQQLARAIGSELADGIRLHAVYLDRIELERQGRLETLPFPITPPTQIVAADISADGDEIIMKDYDNIYYWPLKGKAMEESLKEKPQVLKYTAEPQGEAIGFTRDGSGFFTLSEKISGEKSYLYFYERRSP